MPCVTIGVAAVDDPTGRGVAVMELNGRLTRFQEKPAPWQRTGTHRQHRNLSDRACSACDLVGREQPAMWETDVFPALIARGRRYMVATFPTSGLTQVHRRAISPPRPRSWAGRSHPRMASGLLIQHGSECSMTHWHPPIVIGRDTIVDATAFLEGPTSALGIIARYMQGHGSCVARSGMVALSSKEPSSTTASSDTILTLPQERILPAL